MIVVAQSQIATIKEQVGDLYTDITITEKDNDTIIYTYYLAQDAGFDFDTDALKPIFVKQLEPIINSVKSMVSDIKMQVIFINPDGSETINMTYT
ncbi:hypothetical protein ACYSNW_09835 [Enterococcus sp. LJL99]